MILLNGPSVASGWRLKMPPPSPLWRAAVSLFRGRNRPLPRLSREKPFMHSASGKQPRRSLQGSLQGTSRYTTRRTKLKSSILRYGKTGAATDTAACSWLQPCRMPKKQAYYKECLKCGSATRPPSICMNLSGSGRRASGAGIIKIPEKTRSFILWIWDRLGRIH